MNARNPRASALLLLGGLLALRNREGTLLAALHVTQAWRPDVAAEAAAVFEAFGQGGGRQRPHPLADAEQPEPAVRRGRQWRRPVGPLAVGPGGRDTAGEAG